MKIFYVCEICGKSSGDPAQITRCENQGTRNVYAKGQQVIFAETSAKNCQNTREGIITGIMFKMGSHMPRYQILSGGTKHQVNELRIRGLAKA